ncbi:MAG: SDR family oxidoreductase [Eggerthellales bacterium]|nr:SDR family oxidoreductase [Eggerthellales bacterium]
MAKVQIITGGTSGMGLETAKAISHYGPVVITGRSQKKLDAALAQLAEAGVEAYGTPCDVSKREDVEHLAEFASQYGEIGNVIHAAGVDMDNADSPTIVRINVGGTINVVDTFLGRMEHGALINFSSVTGYFYGATEEDYELWDDPYQDGFLEKFEAAVHKAQVNSAMLTNEYNTYAASKSFVMRYTADKALRYAEQGGNRIFSIAPGSYDTPMLQLQGEETYENSEYITCIGRVGQPSEMAALVDGLLNPAASYLTGVDILADGGMVARMLASQLD